MTDSMPRLTAELLLSALECESVGVAIYAPVNGGADLRYLYVNPAFQALKPFRQMRGRLYSEMWPELTAIALPRFREVLETGEPLIERETAHEVEQEDRVLRRRYFTYEISRLTVGGEIYLLVTATDVTAEVDGRVALSESESKYRTLFTSLIDGFALHEMVLDAEGSPVDYVFLEVNEAFERLSGLKAEDIVGKRVTEVLPGIENDPADWIGMYGRVALTGEAARFEQYSQPLDKWYQVSAYRPQKMRFVTVFDDITERKRAEEEREAAMRSLAEKDRAIRQAYSDVIDAVTGGRLVILGHDELQSAVIGESGQEVEICEPSELGEARRRVGRIVGDIPEQHGVMLAFSEGATNMLKHAGGGTYRVCKDDRHVQIVLSDNGHGIDFRNLPKATLTPGFSTEQTLGMGFTLMMELMDRVLLCTDSSGTTLLLEKDLGGAR